MDEWLTYQDAGERLGISAEAVRQRAMRGHWPRRRSNEGVALVEIPEGVVVRRRTPVEQANEQSPANGHEHPLERLVAALEGHIETLKADLALARSELASEREAAREAAEAYRRLADELARMKAAEPVRAAPRRAAAPRPSPAPEPAAAAIPREAFETEAGMEAIRKRLEARLASRGH